MRTWIKELTLADLILLENSVGINWNRGRHDPDSFPGTHLADLADLHQELAEESDRRLPAQSGMVLVVGGSFDKLTER